MHRGYFNIAEVVNIQCKKLSSIIQTSINKDICNVIFNGKSWVYCALIYNSVKCFLATNEEQFTVSKDLILI